MTKNDEKRQLLGCRWGEWFPKCNIFCLFVIVVAMPICMPSQLYHFLILIVIVAKASNYTNFCLFVIVVDVPFVSFFILQLIVTVVAKVNAIPPIISLIFSLLIMYNVLHLKVCVVYFFLIFLSLLFSSMFFSVPCMTSNGLSFSEPKSFVSGQTVTCKCFVFFQIFFTETKPLRSTKLQLKTNQLHEDKSVTWTNQ